MQAKLNDIIEKSAFIIEGKDREKLLEDLHNIIGLLNKLEELDTQEVEPLAFITDNVNITREDEVSDNGNLGMFLSNSKNINAGYFIVPKFSNN